MAQTTTKGEITRNLVSHHAELTRYLSLRVRTHEDAKELAQEAYLRILRLDDNHLIEHPEAYLFRIASNLVHEYYLSTRIVSQLVDSDPEELHSEAPLPETQAMHQQSMDSLQKALLILTPMQRTVLLMHRHEGKKYREIASELGISRDMVKKHLTSALARCREYMTLVDQ